MAWWQAALIERLMLRSYIFHGHDVTLFHDGNLGPNEVEEANLVPLQEIFENQILREKLPSAMFADIFRVHMVKKTDFTWVDTDSIALKTLTLKNGYGLCVEEGGVLNNSLLRMPKNSEALAFILQQFQDCAPPPVWLPRRARRIIRAGPASERLLRAASVSKTHFGPKLLDYAVKNSSEPAEVMPWEAFNPVPWYMNDVLFSAKGCGWNWITEKTMAVHFYFSTLRPRHKNKRPAEGSFVSDIARQLHFEW